MGQGCPQYGPPFPAWRLPILCRAYAGGHGKERWGSSPKRGTQDSWAVASAGKDFSTWNKKQIDRARLVEGRDYTTIAVPPFGGAEGNRGVRIDYHLTIEAAKLFDAVTDWWKVEISS